MISAILLSAGLSVRFGSPKALAKINHLTAVEHLQNTLVSSNTDEVIVVLGGHFERITPHILNHKKVKVVYNKDYNLGQTSSLKAGLNGLSAASLGFMVFPVDTPLVKTETVNRLIAVFTQETPKILIPTYQGKKGHPPVFAAELKRDLLSLDLNMGLNVFERAYMPDTVLLEVEDSGILKSFNTPEEFKTL